MDCATFVGSFINEKGEDALVDSFNNVMSLWTVISTSADTIVSHWFERDDNDVVLKCKFSNKNQINAFLSKMLPQDIYILYGVPKKLTVTREDKIISIKVTRCQS